MADQILQIGAEFDVGPIIAGAAQAGVAFDQLKVKFQSIATQAEASGNTIQAQAARFMATGLSANEAASALVNLGTSETEAATASAAVASQAGIAAIQLESVAKAAVHAGAGMNELTAGMGRARVVMGGLEGSTGMMAGGLARMAGQSQLLAPLIEAAFPVFAAFAFVEILRVVISGIYEATDAIAGWDSAAKKAYAEAAAANLENINKQIENTNKLREQNEIGLEGAAKHSVAIKNLSAEQKDWTEALTGTARQIRDVQTHLEELKSLSNRAITFAVGISAAPDQIKKMYDDIAEAEAKLTRLQKTEKEQREKLQAIPIAESGEKKTAAVDEQKQALELLTANAEKRKTITEAAIAFDESATRREYESHRITLEQETSQLVAEEQRRIVAVRAFYAEQESILRTKGKETGEDIAPKLTTLAGQREAEEEKSRTKIADIQAKGVQEEFRRDQERALHAIEVDHQIAAADEALAVHKAEIALKKSDTPEEIGAASAKYVQETTRAIQDQITAIEQENAVLAKDPSEAAQTKLAENQAKIHVLKIDEEKKDIDIQEETKSRIEAYYSEQLSVQKTSTEESLRDVEDKNRQVSEVYKRQFDEREISAQTFYKDVEKAASDEFIAEATILAQQLQVAQTYYDSDLISYKEYAARKAEINKQIADANRKMWDEINQAAQAGAKRQEEDIKKLTGEWANDWVKMTNEVLTGKERIGVALRQMAAQMELEMIDNGIKKIVQETTTYLLKVVLAWVKAEAGITAAQQSGASTQSGVGIIGEVNVAKNAAQDAAKVFHQVFNAIPLFPVNLIAATAAAGLVFTAEMATGQTSGGGSGAGGGGGGGTLGDAGGGAISAEGGAIVPGIGRSGVAMLAHPEEMVLPSPISKGLQGAIPAIHNFNAAMEGSKSTTASSLIQNSSKSETTNQGSRHTHVEISFNGGSGNLKHEDIVKSVQRGIRRGEIRL